MLYRTYSSYISPSIIIEFFSSFLLVDFNASRNELKILKPFEASEKQSKLEAQGLKLHFSSNEYALEKENIVKDLKRILIFEELRCGELGDQSMDYIGKGVKGCYGA
ncbi:hypothetical protein GOBAR_DD28164 [Gossypium barbadense]|nr:hypothetical protein GOBAR_DD28164 [Gossypium barbadense]